MPVFKPKTRMISFRLSEDEYEWLRQDSLAKGARSVSDYARLILCRIALGGGESNRDGAEEKLLQIGHRLNELDREVQRLAHLVEPYTQRPDL
jgi:hypothetical protein